MNSNSNGCGFAFPAVVARRASKKVRKREEEPSDEGGDDEMQEGGRAKPFSFRDAILNNELKIPIMESAWESDDFDLQKDDVTKTVVDGVPTIDFS